MKKLLSVLIILSSINVFADAGLDEAVIDVKNNINITQVAIAVVCAEDLTRGSCPLSRVLIVGENPLMKEIKLLRRALETIELFSADELTRIQNALASLESDL